VTKTSQSQPLQLISRQPWLRDQYATLRTETGPRLQHAREVVVPVLADTSQRVRNEVLPAAAHLSSRVAEEAMQRSAPLRAEVTDRAAATLAAARGHVSAAQIEQLQHGRSHRKFWIISGAAAVGAALGTAAVLWQRSRYQAWVEDEAVHSTLDESADPERLDSTNPHDASDPTNSEHASSGGRHGNQRQ
jgi:hypothetical protein